MRPVVGLGYYGIEGEHRELRPPIPFKRHGGVRGHGREKATERTPGQTAFNREVSRERIVVEHAISRPKKFRAMADEFRNGLR